MGRPKVNVTDKARSYPISLKPRSIAELLRIQSYGAARGEHESLGEIVTRLVEKEVRRLDRADTVIDQISLSPAFQALANETLEVIRRAMQIDGVSLNMPKPLRAIFSRRGARVSVEVNLDGDTYTVSGENDAGVQSGAQLYPTTLRPPNGFDIAVMVVNQLLELCGE